MDRAIRQFDGLATALIDKAYARFTQAGKEITDNAINQLIDIPKSRFLGDEEETYRRRKEEDYPSNLLSEPFVILLSSWMVVLVAILLSQQHQQQLQQPL